MDNSKRYGKFTSSQMYRLAGSLKSGKPSSSFKTYVDEVNAERSMSRVSSTEVKTQPMKWGSLMEIVLFNSLDMGWTMTHKQTIVHDKYDFYSGTPDFIAVNKIAEAKCYQPKNFALLSMCLQKEDVNLFKNDFPKEYWQCVSNAILAKKYIAVIMAYMPYKKDLIDIIKKIEDTNFLESNGLNPQDYYFISSNDIESLPYLPDDSKMKDINTFEFDIPQEDIDFLTKRIISANDEVIKMLNDGK